MCALRGKAVLARLGKELPAEIDRRLRPLEEPGEKQVIIDMWCVAAAFEPTTAYGGRAEKMIAAWPATDTNLIASCPIEFRLIQQLPAPKGWRKEEVLIVAYYGPRRSAAAVVNERTVTSPRGAATSPLVVVCAKAGP
jgi:hypothetical protein